MTKSNKVGSFGIERKKWKGKGFKPRKGGNKTNLSGNKCKSEKRVGILVTLLVIALSQR